jgi:FkbM family methyltransferase
MIKKILKFILKSVGLQKIPTLPSLSLQSALERIMVKDIKIETVIDVGASNGSWSKIVQQYFPKAFYYLIEANPYHLNSLEKFKLSSENIDFLLAAAGDINGEIYFDASDPFGGLASHTSSQGANIKVPIVTIDSVCKLHDFQPPFLIKLDTHGFEIPIFEGASEILNKTNLVIVETYNFNIAENSLRFHKICEYLENKGFRCIDICDPLFREKDLALWQFDLFFIRSDHPAFLCNSWK